MNVLIIIISIYLLGFVLSFIFSGYNGDNALSTSFMAFLWPIFVLVYLVSMIGVLPYSLGSWLSTRKRIPNWTFKDEVECNTDKLFY